MSAPHLPPPRAELEALAQALDQVATWIRRVTPRGAHSAVAMTVLDTVVTEGPTRVTDLAARERVTQPGMTAAVNRLVEAGLVERHADPDDGRAVRVAATPAGRAYLRERHAARASLLAEELALLDPQLQRRLVAATASLDALSADPRTAKEHS